MSPPTGVDDKGAADIINRCSLVICFQSLPIGDVNYNENGVKDVVGFEEVTEKFVDNFLVRILVPDYNMKKGKNMFLATQNKMIRDLLDANGLKKCVVKAVFFKKVQPE